MLGGGREYEETSEWQRSWLVFIDQLQNKAYLFRIYNGFRQQYLCELSFSFFFFFFSSFDWFVFCLMAVPHSPTGRIGHKGKQKRRRRTLRESSSLRQSNLSRTEKAKAMKLFHSLWFSSKNPLGYGGTFDSLCDKKMHVSECLFCN